jgi:hypothetical protein
MFKAWSPTVNQMSTLPLLNASSMSIPLLSSIVQRHIATQTLAAWERKAEGLSFCPGIISHVFLSFRLQLAPHTELNMLSFSST